MRKKEYLEEILKANINNDKVVRIQNLYGAELPEIIKRIISNSDESQFFDDDTRILSDAEILDAKQDLHIDFKSKGIIPIADCNENNFIVYHFNDNIWSKFNIVDESVYNKKESFSDLFLT